MTWLKDDAPLDAGLVNIRTSEVDTILFIRQATREHSGLYTLSVQIENMEDKVNLEIQIVGWCQQNDLVEVLIGICTTT